MGLPEVSTILWRERNLLDLLLFKLEEERLVLRSGLSRWLPRAVGEVEMVLAELRCVEEARAGALDSVAAELGLQPGRDLGEVAAAAPPPWHGLLEQHRAAFRDATAELGPLERVHRDLLGRRETDAALAWVDAAEAASRVDGDPGRDGFPADLHTALRVLADES